VKNLSPSEEEERRKLREEAFAQERRRQKEREIEQQKKVVQVKTDIVEKLVAELEVVEQQYNEAMRQLNQLRFKQFEESEDDRYTSKTTTNDRAPNVRPSTTKSNSTHSIRTQTARRDFSSKISNNQSNHVQKRSWNSDSSLKTNKIRSIVPPKTQESTFSKPPVLRNSPFFDNSDDNDELEELDDEPDLRQHTFDSFNNNGDSENSNDDLEEELDELDEIETEMVRVATTSSLLHRQHYRKGKT